MSCRWKTSSCSKLAVAAFAALGAMVTMGTHAQRAWAEDAEDSGQEEGRIVEISPDIGDAIQGAQGQRADARERLRLGQALIAGDQAARPAFWLGIQGQPLASDVLRTHLQLAEGVGVVVEQVVPGSPAEKAGVRKHDVLLAVNGEQISDMTVLQQAVADSEGKPIELKVIRLAKEITIEATPEATPANMDFGAAPDAGGVPFPGGPGMFGGRALPIDEIQAMLQQMQQNGVAGGMRVLGPGMIVGGQPLNLQNMPQNVQVTITRDNDGPAKVTVKRGDESWTLEDGDREGLAKLPDDVRPFVEQMLQNDAAAGGASGQLGAFHFNFDGQDMDAIRQQAEEAARNASQAAARGAQELNQNLIQRLEELEKHLQQLEQQIQQDSGEEGAGSSDPNAT